jgi:uncharacterized protein (TIGR00369 family)
MIPAHITLEDVNRHIPNTLMETLGIRYSSVGTDHLSATMNVSPATHQPMGILHGGASMALAETVASAASFLIIDSTTQAVVGLELNANHVRSKSTGVITGTARAIHIGSRTHIWEVRIEDEEGRLISIARMTNMVLSKTNG